MDRAESLGREALERLRALARELLARKPGAHLVGPSLRTLDVGLAVPLRGDPAESERLAREVVTRIDALLDDAVQRAAAFRPGHVFCHRCERAECAHSRPPSSRHVFLGYTPTGVPRWIELAQLCLELRHPEVDRLYDDPPALVTLVQGRAELGGGVLRAFANPAYELIGQVVAGFFRVRPAGAEGRGVVALSIQAAAWRSPRGGLRVGVNLLGCAPSGDDVSALWDGGSEPPWTRPVQWAQSALETLSARTGRSAEAGPEVERRVRAILLGLSRRLARDRRARSRRTQHALERHVSGERPTRSALDDARRVRIGACYFDERTRTWVVLGERGRTHFFTAAGQHVSSVRYSREAIARKVKIERWREASPDEVEALRAKLPP